MRMLLQSAPVQRIHCPPVELHHANPQIPRPRRGFHPLRRLATYRSTTARKPTGVRRRRRPTPASTDVLLSTRASTRKRPWTKSALPERRGREQLSSSHDSPKRVATTPAPNMF